MKIEGTKKIDESADVKLKQPKDYFKLLNKKKKKKYIKISTITLSSVIVVFIICILVGHFKYDIFHKKNREIYKIAEINREVYSEEFFSEIKKVKSKMTYTEGEFDEKEQNIITDFVVIVTDKESLENNDTLNTASLVILESKIKMEDKEAPLHSFNIFEEKKVQEFEEEPNGTKYPMAIFHFYENGTKKDILLPEGMDKDDAQNMIDLINNVVPKLTRNKTEDNEKGLQIKTKEIKKEKKIKSFTEYEPKKEFQDKYTKSRFRGSKITRSIERDVKEAELTEIRSNISLYLETQKEENKTINFGIQSFYYNSSSIIIATGKKKDKKDDIILINKLSSKLNFRDSEELLQEQIDKEAEEQNKTIEELLHKEDSNTIESRFRNLGWPGHFEYQWPLVSTNILGNEVKIYYYIELKGGSVMNAIIVKFGTISITIGNSRGTSNKMLNGKEHYDDKEVAKIPFGFPYVTFSFKLGANFDYSVDYSYGVFLISLNGEIYAKAGVDFGIQNVASLEVGVKGSFLRADFTNYIVKNMDEDSNYIQRTSIKATAGNLSVYAIAKVWIVTVFDESRNIWDGWTITIN
jgi:hypothetical protein